MGSSARARMMVLMPIVVVVVQLLLQLAHSASPSLVSALPDPRMQAPNPAVLIEGWNFCNRAGSGAVPGLNLQPSPRYADCVAANGTQLVSAADNAAFNLTDADGFAVAKHIRLADLCTIDRAQGVPRSFWTAMLKSGNFIEALGLCKKTSAAGGGETPAAPAAVEGSFDNKPMNQPLVAHSWSRAGPSGVFEGMFNGTWDVNASGDPTSSYFEFQWLANPSVDAGAGAGVGAGAPSAAAPKRLFRQYIRTSEAYPWLMLYVGVDAAAGQHGGIDWDSRGAMWPLPRQRPGEFNVTYFFNMTSFAGPPGATSMYVPNLGACWQNDGSPCTGDYLKDVTRYVLMETNPGYGRGCTKDSPHACPPWHQFVNGTRVAPGDPSYPYAAYKYWCYPGNASPPPSHGGPCDPYSNPMSQTILKLAPHPEWALHGFPGKPGDAWVGDARHWNLDVGGLLSRLYHYGTTPENAPWTTVNIGPEAGIGDWQGSAVEVRWDIGDFDVLVPSSQ